MDNHGSEDDHTLREEEGDSSWHESDSESSDFASEEESKEEKKSAPKQTLGKRSKKAQEAAPDSCALLPLQTWPVPRVPGSGHGAWTALMHAGVSVNACREMRPYASLQAVLHGFGTDVPAVPCPQGFVDPKAVYVFEGIVKGKLAWFTYVDGQYIRHEDALVFSQDQVREYFEPDFAALAIYRVLSTRERVERNLQALQQPSSIPCITHITTAPVPARAPVTTTRKRKAPAVAAETTRTTIAVGRLTTWNEDMWEHVQGFLSTHDIFACGCTTRSIWNVVMTFLGRRWRYHGNLMQSSCLPQNLRCKVEYLNRDRMSDFAYMASNDVIVDLRWVRNWLQSTPCPPRLECLTLIGGIYPTHVLKQNKHNLSFYPVPFHSLPATVREVTLCTANTSSSDAYKSEFASLAYRNHRNQLFFNAEVQVLNLLGYSFSSRMPWPQALVVLRICFIEHFDCPLPPTLLELHLGVKYHTPFREGILPHGLRVLTIDWNQPETSYKPDQSDVTQIWPHEYDTTYPINIQYSITKSQMNDTNPIPLEYIPDTVQKLVLFTCQKKLVRLPAELQEYKGPFVNFDQDFVWPSSVHSITFTHGWSSVADEPDVPMLPKQLQKLIVFPYRAPHYLPCFFHTLPPLLHTLVASHACIGCDSPLIQSSILSHSKLRELTLYCDVMYNQEPNNLRLYDLPMSLEYLNLGLFNGKLIGTRFPPLVTKLYWSYKSEFDQDLSPIAWPEKLVCLHFPRDFTSNFRPLPSSVRVVRFGQFGSPGRVENKLPPKLECLGMSQDYNSFSGLCLKVDHVVYFPDACTLPEAALSKPKHKLDAYTKRSIRMMLERPSGTTHVQRLELYSFGGE